MRAMLLALTLLSGCSTVDGWFSQPETTDAATTACEDYCASMTASCPDTFVDENTCFDACLDLDMNGVEGDRNGDTLQCRTTAIELGLCEYAGVDSELCSSDEEHTGQLPDDSGVQ
jgi:hypothetical protein